MSTTVEEDYIAALLAYACGGREESEIAGDYASLIHVPAEGPERVYSIGLDTIKPIMTQARFCAPVWDRLNSVAPQPPGAMPGVELLRAEVVADHPVFEFLGRRSLQRCRDRSDGQRGMDYYLLMWRRDGGGDVVECWEPYGRRDIPWMTVISAMQTLASQFEYKVQVGRARKPRFRKGPRADPRIFSEGA